MAGYVRKCVAMVWQAFGPPPAGAVAYIPISNKFYDPSGSWNGILWNVPKQRKNKKQKMAERYGMPYKWGTGRILRENRRIRTDYATGEFFELGRLGKKTYDKVMAETKVIQEAIAKTFGRFNPKDKEVTVYYHGEAPREEGKMPVEILKERPPFFCRNLTQKTRTPSDSSAATTVRPKGLG